MCNGRGRRKQMNWWVTDRTDAKTAALALIEHKEHTNMKPKNTICLWFDKDAHEAAQILALANLLLDMVDRCA